ncbi:MAG: hypothetical protein ACFCD0_01515 [Gemmataceae bacterium]
MFFRCRRVLVPMWFFAVFLLGPASSLKAQMIQLANVPKVLGNPKSVTPLAEFGVPAIHSSTIGTQSFWLSSDGTKVLTVHDEKFLLRSPGTDLVRERFVGKFVDDKRLPNVGRRLQERTLAVGECGDTFRLAWKRNDEVQVWNVETERLLCKFPFASLHGNAQQMLFSGNGKFLAIWQYADQGKANILEVWDLATGKKRCQCTPPKSAVFCHVPVLSEDGQLLAVATHQRQDQTVPKTVYLWDTTNGKLLFKLEGLRTSMFDLRFSRNGRRLIGMTSLVHIQNKRQPKPLEIDGKVLVWDTKTGKTIVEVENWFRNSAVSPSGLLLARQLRKQTGFQVVDLTNGKVHQQRYSGNHFVVFSPDEKLLAIYQGGNGIDFYELSSGKLVRPCENSAYSPPVGFTKDGKRFVAAKWTYTGSTKLRAWNVSTGKEILPKKGHTDAVVSVRFSPDGSHVASYGKDNKVCIWNEKAKTQIGEGTTESDVLDVGWTPCGQNVVFVNKKGTVQWIDRKGKAIEKFSVGSGVSTARFADNGRTVVVHKTQVEVFDLKAKKLIKKFRISTNGPQEALPRFAFFQIKTHFEVSPDGRYLAHCAPQTVSETGHIRLDLYNTVTGRRIRSIQLSHKQQQYEHTVCTCIRFSPDGRYLLTSTGNASNSLRGVMYSNIRIRIWEIDSGQKVYTSDDMALNATFLEMSPRGWFIAHPDGKRQRWRLFQHLKVVLQPSFTPKEPILGSDPLNGKMTRQFSAEPSKFPSVMTTGRPTSVSFSPDGKRLAVGTERHTVLIQDVSKLTVPPKRIGFGVRTPTNELVEQLGSSRAQGAYAAMQQLTLRHEDAITALEKKLKPATGIPANKINKWIADLDNKRYAVRQRAYSSLVKVGRVAEPELRKARASNKSLEFLQRVQKLLHRLEDSSPELLQMSRQIALLERIGSNEAIQLLQKLAKGHPNADLTRLAKTALRRLVRR